MRKNDGRFVIFGSNLLFFLPRLLIPLVIGSLFGIVAERITYGLVILTLCLNLTKALDILRNEDILKAFLEYVERRTKHDD
jgi:hypothetical protein